MTVVLIYYNCKPTHPCRMIFTHTAGSVLFDPPNSSFLCQIKPSVSKIHLRHSFQPLLPMPSRPTKHSPHLSTPINSITPINPSPKRSPGYVKPAVVTQLHLPTRLAHPAAPRSTATAGAGQCRATVHSDCLIPNRNLMSQGEGCVYRSSQYVFNAYNMIRFQLRRFSYRAEKLIAR